MVEGRIPRFWSDECGRSRFGECRRIGWISVLLRAVGLWDIKEGFVGSEESLDFGCQGNRRRLLIVRVEDFYRNGDRGEIRGRYEES